MRSIAIFLATLLAACAPGERPSVADPVQQVMDTERAFARTMADRDHAAFSSFLSEEAVFFAGEETLRGRQQVADGWKPYFESPQAPFSWEPAQVVVLDSGTLALSTGPVYDGEGRTVAMFNSIWRREAGGVWRIVFDKGSPACERALAAK